MKEWIKEHKVEIAVCGGGIALGLISCAILKKIKIDIDIRQLQKNVISVDDLKDIQGIKEAYMVCKDADDIWCVIDANGDSFVEFAANYIG